MDEPVLYILMRTDMASMNPGKAMAQAAHAANQFQSFMENVGTARLGMPEVSESVFHSMDRLYKLWLNQAENFGTTIVLGVNLSQLNHKMELIPTLQEKHVIGHATWDPTYPLLDGDTLHLLDIPTCGWVFGNKNNLSLQFLLGDLELHP